MILKDENWLLKFKSTLIITKDKTVCADQTLSPEEFCDLIEISIGVPDLEIKVCKIISPDYSFSRPI